MFTKKFNYEITMLGTYVCVRMRVSVCDHFNY